MDYSAFPTEGRNPRTTHIDKMPTCDMLKLMSDENRRVEDAVEAAIPQITEAVDAVADRMKRGGRLIYIGAGTSGRLGVLDASECPPTFGVEPSLVCGIIAGGDRALRFAVEGGEDSADAGKHDIEALSLTAEDSVIGISAAGGAAYVVSALKTAAEHGCYTAVITSNPHAEIAKTAKTAIIAQTGAEVITGSTRLKAGTAQKLILNMISTSVMIKTGKVYENMMINVRPTNIKLRDRAERIICTLTDCEREKAAEALCQAGDSVYGAVCAIKGEKL